MGSAGNVAFRMLASWDFFGHVRSVLPGVGLSEEEKVGVGIFFVMISRFRPLPLRLAIQEKTEGGTNYVLKHLSQLLEPGTICNLYSPAGWARFVESPAHKVAYVRDWSGSKDGSLRAQIDDNRLTRFLRSNKDGRVVEEPQSVEESFVCISSQRPRATLSPGRWLTLTMPPPPWKVSQPVPLDAKGISTWVEVQRHFEKRARTDVVLPDWADVFIHQACRKDYSRWCLPAFLEAWKTMSLLRSFREPERWEKATRRSVYVANFEDLAETGLLLRGAFREGQAFPSVQKIFADVFPENKYFSAVNPLTGKAKDFSPLRQKSTRYKSLLDLSSLGK